MYLIYYEKKVATVLQIYHVCSIRIFTFNELK
jgi:hypothetical protein